MTTLRDLLNSEEVQKVTNAPAKRAIIFWDNGDGVLKAKRIGKLDVSDMAHPFFEAIRDAAADDFTSLS